VRSNRKSLILRCLFRIISWSRQPAWFHQLEEILEDLRALEISHLDRLAIQKLFRVRERRARQIMGGLPALRVGNAIAVERQALIARLESTATGDRFQWETARRARLVEDLDRTRRQLAARRVRIPAAADVRDRSVRQLGGGIDLRPGELRIEFYGAEDLAAKLFEVSQAMANDWQAFAKAVEQDASSLPRSGTAAAK
jgi:hypothetical protein